MGEFSIQISNDLVDQLVDDTVTKKKTRRIRRKVPRQAEKPQSNVTEKLESATDPGWPVQPPLFLPTTLPKQEENMLQEVTQKTKDLHDREYKLPNPKPEPCMAERLATLACYKEHIKDPLKCVGHVTNFADCLRKFGRLSGKFTTLDADEGEMEKEEDR
ncbi:Cysteine alpha-hairpin motif superfamily [Sesbania bispinosa]|nr:Cysteine alpha-hairpin motif superfamily [Sesbania bispinosa]